MAAMRLDGQVALVTGGGAGIGRAIARKFAAEGARVAVVDQSADSAAAVAEELGECALGLTGDVTVAADVERAFAQVDAAYSRLDILVNNAFLVTGDSVVRMDEETWEADVRGTLTSAFICTQRALGGMVERRRGSIINISSVNGLSFFGNEAYSAAKAGLNSLTTSIATRYGRYGIRANAIAPGSVRTAAWEKRIAAEPAVLERLVKWFPLGRLGEPEDIAGAAVFLASDDASWVTGVVLRVDGGLLAGNPVMADELLVESRDHEL